MRQFRVGLHAGQFRIGDLAAELNDLRLRFLGNFEQLLVLLLHQGGAFRFGGGALGVQFLTQVRQAIRPRVLAHLNLAFDLRLLQITQPVLLDDGAVERVGHAGELRDPLLFLLLQFLLVLGLVVLQLLLVFRLGGDEGFVRGVQFRVLLQQRLFRRSVRGRQGAVARSN